MDPKRHKGALVSPTMVEVLEAVRTHVGATLQGLHKKALPHLAEEAVRHALYHLQTQRHVHAVVKTCDGVRHWYLGARPEAKRPAGVVPPRQMDVMHGPLYQPGPPAPTRPGAMDYARYPSNFCGERRPFKGGM